MLLMVVLFCCVSLIISIYLKILVHREGLGAKLVNKGSLSYNLYLQLPAGESRVKLVQLFQRLAVANSQTDLHIYKKNICKYCVYLHI